jgi:hypothetical protein
LTRGGAKSSGSSVRLLQARGYPAWRRVADISVELVNAQDNRTQYVGGGRGGED